MRSVRSSRTLVGGDGRSVESGREPEALECLGVEERMDGFDAVATQLDHLERPRDVPPVGVDSILREGRATIGFTG